MYCREQNLTEILKELWTFTSVQQRMIPQESLIARQAQADRVPSLQISLTWLVINNLVTGATLHSSEIINLKIYCAS